MPEVVNTSSLDLEASPEQDDRPTMIAVDDVSMVFNMASESLNNLKEYAIALAKRELRFKELRALDGVSFEVKKGDVFGIVGTNGSGKSTMLKIVAGVLEPSEGNVEINGSIAPLIELGAGFDMELTARENIYLNGALLGYSKKFIESHFDEIVDFAEVEKFLDMPMKNYSSGMVARIAFAIATVIVPEILIVDEVLSVGDFMFQRKCEDRISELIEQHGVTVLIVSHSNEQIARLCNKAIWIEKGRTRLLGDADLVTRVYGGLAGRTGSPEAEARIFEALRDLGEEPVVPSKTIGGETPAALSARMTMRAWDGSPHDTFVLVCDNTHANTVIASAVSGALDAPLFAIKEAEIPNMVMDALLDERPQRLLVVDCENKSTVAREMLRELPWPCAVERIGETDRALEYSLAVLEKGAARSLWAGSALLVHACDNAESMALTPFLAADRCPALIATTDMAAEADALCASLRAADIDTVYIAGTAISPTFDETAQRHGLHPLRLPDSPDGDRCLALGKFVADRLDQGERAHREALFATRALAQWPELITCGYYGSKKGAPLMLVDETDLDSMDAFLDLVHDQAATGLQLTFVGDRMGLSEVARQLLTCAPLR